MKARIRKGWHLDAFVRSHTSEKMLTTLEHLCVRVVYCNIKPKCLEQDIFIVYELLSLLNVLLSRRNELFYGIYI